MSLAARETRSIARFAVYEVTRLIIILLVTAHWIGCWWLVVISARGASSSSEEEDGTWQDCDRGGMVRSRDYGKMYVCSFYWAVQTVTTVGLGDLPGWDFGPWV